MNRHPASTLLARTAHLLGILATPILIPFGFLLGASLYLHLRLFHLLFRHQRRTIDTIHQRISILLREPPPKE